MHEAQNNWPIAHYERRLKDLKGKFAPSINEKEEIQQLKDHARMYNFDMEQVNNDFAAIDDFEEVETSK